MALLAVELFEVITIRVVDTFQQLIRSPQLPERVRSLCSHQTSNANDDRELLELLRLWLPLLLTKVGPALRPQLVALIGHLLQQSLSRSVMPEPLRRVAALQSAEAEFSRQLATGMVDRMVNTPPASAGRVGKHMQK